ncbi:H/ACA ribonucleoprotein complex non-core subunit NAF1-like [Durio zibethinus]|uniref:H/ACA ribonucleoprotein complex non-core subunit NAF1 n=1 Tax=Durio zibethinus TaxID=66656 RepID=A0A6P5Z2P7_DURZI|nr:H/ACA ribonucleoprotein complex non-core subunit NAF1-like [Durio zibethinus]XP_022746592.1 H/ACA ribonucleoprotein complex non-core subunit NAF1-like [Durio zibethinus]
MEIGKEDKFEKTHLGDPSVGGSELNVDWFKPIVCGSALVGGKSGSIVKVEEEESKPEGKLSSSIEEEIGKVSLVDGLESGSSSSEESESESSSSLSPSSSSNDDDDDDDDDDDEEEEEEEEQEEENKEKLKLEIEREVYGADELEEGEIGGIDGEIIVGGISDDEEEDETEEILSAYGIEFDEVDDDEEDVGAVRGPIRSKNELEVLPPVPPLDVTLQPHHQMLPVGIVLSMIGTKVVVEGRKQHNPLNEGSILWITIDGSPLGFVDEIFGPVKNPYYIVRYNSESEVPAGIHEGTSISFVPEFASHVLNDKNLRKKGYDASGENDEELSDDAEFSDDEKEAEYKRMQKMTKRGMNDQKVGNWKSNKKKVKSRNRVWKNDRNSAQQTSTLGGQLPPNKNQHNFSTVSASLGNQNFSSSVVGEQNFIGGSGFVSPFSVMPQSSGIITYSNGAWTNGMPGQQQQNAIFPNKFSAEGLPLLSQNYQQQPIPLPTPAMSMPTMMPYQQQQFDPSLSTLPNTILPGGQSSLFARPTCAPWLGIAGQNGISQTTFGTGMQGQQLLNALQGILTNGPRIDGNCNLQPKGVQGNPETSQNFSMGASSSRGKKPYHRGRGPFTRGKGHQQS